MSRMRRQPLAFDYFTPRRLRLGEAKGIILPALTRLSAVEHNKIRW
jgi:hypothetical protein